MLRAENADAPRPPAPRPRAAAELNGSAEVRRPPTGGDRSSAHAAASTWDAPAEPVRQWLARELHDGVVQTLTTMVIDLEILQREERAAGGVHSRLTQVQATARSALNQLRELLREVREPAPDVFDFEGRVEALLRHYQATSGIGTRLATSPDWPAVLHPELAFNLQRILEEALRNAWYHSGARQVTVALDAMDHMLILTVMDDGNGIDWLRETVQPRGMGILGMHERALILGGQLDICTPPEGGTMVRVAFMTTVPA